MEFKYTNINQFNSYILPIAPTLNIKIFDKAIIDLLIESSKN